MSVSRFQPIIINNGQVHNSTLTSNSDEKNTTTNSNIRPQTAENAQQHHSHQQEEQPQQKQQLNDINNVKTSNNSALSDVDRNETTTTRATTETNTAVPKIASITEIYTQTSSSTLTTQSPNTASSSPYTSPSATTSKSYSKMNMNNRSSSTATTNNEIIYKFYVPRNIGVATARITFGQVCSHCPDVGFHIQANAFPSIGTEAEKSHESNYIHSTIIKPNQTGEISIEFYVQPMTWHYALLKFVSQRGLMVNSVLGQTRPETKQNEQVRLRSTEHLYRLKRHEGNETSTWYHLPFVMQIDYHEPLDVDQKSESKENAEKHDEMQNEYTNENFDNETSSNITQTAGSIQQNLGPQTISRHGVLSTSKANLS